MTPLLTFSTLDPDRDHKFLNLRESTFFIITMDLHVVCLPDKEKLFYFTVSHQLFASLRGWGSRNSIFCSTLIYRWYTWQPTELHDENEK